MALRRLAGVAAALAGLALAAQGMGLGATPSRGAESGSIVFVSNRDGYQQGEIYSLAPGRAPRNITHNRAADVDLAISPVGDTIAFWSNRSGEFRLYLARSDGSNLRVVDGLRTIGSPNPSSGTAAIVFSHDGRRLFTDSPSIPEYYGAPVAGPGDSTPGTYVVDVAQRTARQVLPALNCQHLSPSPDGRSLACFTDSKLVTVYDLSGQTRFAFASDRQPLWSRLDMLASSVDTYGNHPSSSILDESGRTVAQFRGTVCDWSPDGRRLVFEQRGVVRVGNPRDLARAKIIPGVSQCVLYAAGGRYFEATSTSGQPVVIPVSGGEPIRWPAHDNTADHNPISEGAWSGDGRFAFITGYRATAVFGPLIMDRITVRIHDARGRGGAVGRFPQGFGELRWPPGARSVLFDTSWDVGSSLYSVPASGGTARRFTSDARSLFEPAWSRDGRHIAYLAVPGCPAIEYGRGCRNVVAVAGADGTDWQDLPVDYDPASSLDHPSFSPDGTRIALLKHQSGSCSIVTVPVGGGPATNLAPPPSCLAPAWSPDGTKIAILFIDYANGLGVTLLDSTTGQTLETIPIGILQPDQTDPTIAWSPDGTQIAFGGRAGIYLLRVSAPASAELVIPIPRAAHPAFSPDGALIAFDVPTTPLPGSTALMVANSDGSNVHVLSRIPFPNTESGYPTWQPGT